MTRTQPPNEPPRPEPDTPEALCLVCAQTSGGRCLGRADCPLGAASVASTDATGGLFIVSRSQLDALCTFAANASGAAGQGSGRREKEAWLQFDAVMDQCKVQPHVPQPDDEGSREANPIAVSPVVRALEQIGRMKLFPDDKINRTTLQAAIHIARQALSAPKGTPDP